jgi:outer membrane protein OmpA-like peptidoglycan-associated protein
MNSIFNTAPRGSALLVVTAAAALLAACAGTPVKTSGAAEARSKLLQLQSNAELASRAPVAIKDAALAVTAAEAPERNAELAAHRVYLADRKVDTARALAETRFAEDQRAVLAKQREGARLDARTREADAARAQAAAAEADSAVQKQAADQARSDAGAAQLATARATEEAAELQRQIDLLQARPADRGLVLTLGDVLFATGKADLVVGATGNLDRLVSFLNSYPDRTAIIEGYTDSVGSEAYNQGLSERRAGSVRSYLSSQGIGPLRLSSSGKGESDPVAGNDSAGGRQQNRRVEVIISNPIIALK